MALARRICWLVGAVVVLAAPSAARADVTIPAGQSVSYLTLIGGDARVDGIVTGPVVIIDGNLVVGSTGALRDGARLLGGHLQAGPGARIAGPVLEIGSPWPELDRRAVIALIAALLLARTLLALAVLAIARLLARRFPRPRGRATLRDRPGRTLLSGALILIGITAASLLLAFSLVGLPVAACLVGLNLLAAAFGISHAVDLTTVDLDDDARLVRRLALAPLVGDALLALATIVGLGIALASWRAPQYRIPEPLSRSTP